MFRAFVENVTDYAIFALDPGGHVETWNEGAARLNGWSAEEIIGQHFSRFYPHDEVQAGKPDAALKAAALDGRAQDEGWRLRKNDSRFWANETITALRGSDGEVLGFFTISRDLTERKRTEDELRASEERHRLVVEDVIDYAIFAVDAEARVATWNTGAERILGYTDPEIIGQPFSTIFTPEDRAAGEDVKEIETATSKGRALDARWHLRRDGSRLWVQGVLTAVRDESGNLRGFSKVMRDSTERKLLETTQRFLAGLSERLRPLAAPGEVMQLSARAIAEHLQVARCYFAELDFAKKTASILAEHHQGDLPDLSGEHPLGDLGLDLEELQRGEAVAVSDTQTDPRTAPRYECCYEPLKTRAFLAVTQRRNKGSAWAIVITAPEGPRLWTPDESELTGTVAERTWMAVHNARLYESAQTAREQAESAGRTKDEFLATLSHELRTPLMPVMMAAHRMRNDPELPEKFHRATDLIRRNVELEARLIDDLLDISRIIHRKLEFTFERVDLHAALRLALEMCEAEVASKNLRLAVELGAERFEVNGDSARLQQVFWNLVRNAVKFTPDGGSVCIRSVNQESSICVEVVDSGIGIDGLHLEKIFQPFEQGSQAASRKFGGLGLGLAIAKATVDAHGGTITVESEGHHRGATFTVHLATVAESGKAQVEQAPPVLTPPAPSGALFGPPSTSGASITPTAGPP